MTTTAPREQLRRYAIAALVSAALIGLAVSYPELSGLDGVTGYAFLVLLVVYTCALASDRVLRSRHFPFLQAGFFLARGGYNALRGRWGLLTVLLLGGGAATVVWEGWRRWGERESAG